MMDTRLWIQYFRRALFAASLLRLVPFVRMVGLNGSLVTGTFHRQSDIDFFIVVKGGHIFITRVLVVSLLRLTGLRRRGKTIAGKICDNRFCIEDFVEITPHDAYHARVFHNLIPLFVDGPAYVHFVENNQWMTDFGEEVVVHQPLLMHNPISLIIQKVLEIVFIFSFWERLAEKWQRGRFEKDWRVLEPGSKVHISNRELKFHLAKDRHGKA